MVERAVYRSVATFPSLYGRTAWARWKIFHHMFFVIGNGYEWKKGKLVYPDDKRSIKKVVWLTPELEAEEREEWRRWAGVKARKVHPDYILERWEWAGSGPPQSLYPICELARIVTIPDDVHPKWLAAAFDAYEMAKVIIEFMRPNNQNEAHERRVNFEWFASIDARLNELLRRSQKPRKEK